MITNQDDMNILTEDQARTIAVESGYEAVQLFIKKFFPDFPKPSESAEPDVLMTADELSVYWKCHKQTIMQKKRKGELPFTQHGRKLLFSKKAIDKLTANPVSKSGR